MSRGRKKGQGKKIKETKPTIALYCEGESEVNYFKMLMRKYRAGNVAAHGLNVKIKAMGGRKGTKLVNAVKKQLTHGKKVNAEEVYLVFDRDDLTVADIRDCQMQARENKFKIIFSSINFEIWILLHFETVQRSYTKAELYKRLSDDRHFNQDYKRFKGSNYDQYLVDKVGAAMSNAQQLNGKPSQLATSDPFTNVHLYLKDIFGRAD